MFLRVTPKPPIMKRLLAATVALVLTIALGATERNYLKISSDTLGIVLMPRLLPLPADPAQRSSLDGEWQFAPQAPAPAAKIAKGSYPRSIQVPGQWLQQGFTVAEGSWAGYAREFATPSKWGSERVFIRFDAVYSQCEVWVNGQKVGSHMGGFTPFDVEVTDVLRGGNNALTLRVRSESVADSAASGAKYACHQLGGISRKVTLFAVPADNYLTYLNATTSFKGEGYSDATLDIEMAASSPASVTAELIDPATNQTVATLSGQYNSAAGDIERLAIPVKNPKLWDPEHPNLYTLRLSTIARGAKKGETAERTIGFRTIAVKGNRVLVNGQPIKLRGVNHHEVMPLRGRSVEAGQWEKDVQLFRDANVNYIRTSHYPPAPELVEACDRLGMFLEIEAPFCWAHNTNIADKDYKEVLEDQTFTMVNLFKSNPSVLMWSVGNESLKWKEYFSRTAAKVAVLDPSRPRIFSQWGPDADDGELEVTNYHYPGPNVAQFANSKRPITFDEYCHLNSYNRLEYITDPSVRESWGIALRDMWEKMYSTPSVLGGAIWGGIDDTFVLPDGSMVGYGTWGPIDGWRRPKPEYWHVKKVYSPVKVTATDLDADGALTLSFENRFLFTNLSECIVEWSTASERDTVMLKAGEGQRTQTTILPPKGSKELTLTITDPRGVEVDRYCFTIGSTPRVNLERTVAQSSLTESGDTIIATVDNVSMRIVRSSGAVTISKGADQVVCATPELMILPLNSEGYGIQMTGEKRDWSPYTASCSGRIVDDVTVREIQGGAIEVAIRDQYLEADGQTVYTLGADGVVDVRFEYTALRAVNPRQWGIVFSLPPTFDQLEWRSQGIWNVYPEDHIARPAGQAVARNTNLDCGPAGPAINPLCAWKDDQNRWGTNDFRSTKINASWTALSSPSRNGLSFGVDGGTGVNTRCWVDSGSEKLGGGTGRIKMVVAPYSNLGSEGFLRSHAEIYDAPLKVGDRIGGEFKLVIR